MSMIFAEAGTYSSADALLAQLEHHLGVIQVALAGAQAEMEAKVLAERERCAKIAEQADRPIRKPHRATEWPCNCGMGEAIAAEIREGK